MKRSFCSGVVLLGCVTTCAFAQTIANPSFELDSYTVWPGYISGNGGVLTGWTATGSGGTTNPAARAGLNSNPPEWVPANTSPFGNNGIYPDGDQVGFIQAVSDASTSSQTTLSNTITGLAAGQSYRLSFDFTSRAGQRPNGEFVVGSSIVNFQGNSVEGGNSFTEPFRTASLVFTATGPTQTFSVSNLALTALPADTTLVIDNFRVAAGTTGWSSTAWTDDSTSGINSALVYSHAFNLASPNPTTINGVDFAGVDGGNPVVPASFSTTGWTTDINGDDTNVLTLGGGGSAELARQFLYGGAAQTAQTLTLEGLTPGVPNRLTLFGVGWSDAGTIARAATFSSGGDTLTMNEHLFGVDQGVKFEFDYIPQSQSQTFTLNPTSSNTTVHLYGFANAVVPEPSSAILLAFSGLMLGWRRRRAESAQ